MTMRRAVSRRPSTASASGADEACLAAQHGGAEGAEAGLGIDRRDGLDHAVHVRAHCVPVDLRFRQAQAEPPCTARRLGGVRGGEQGLARHAAEVEAVAAHPVALDQRHAQAKLRGDRGDRETGGARRRSPPDRSQASERFHRRQATGSSESAARAISGPRMRGEKMIVEVGSAACRQHLADAGADRGIDEGGRKDADQRGRQRRAAAACRSAPAARFTSQKGKAGTSRIASR